MSSSENKWRFLSRGSPTCWVGCYSLRCFPPSTAKMTSSGGNYIHLLKQSYTNYYSVCNCVLKHLKVILFIKLYLFRADFSIFISHGPDAKLTPNRYTCIVFLFLRSNCKKLTLTLITHKFPKHTIMSIGLTFSSQTNPLKVNPKLNLWIFIFSPSALMG